MVQLAKVIRSVPLISFFGLTFLFTWSLLPFASKSIPVSLIALCGPAAAAFVVTAFYERKERREFYTRVNDWRIRYHWYLIALLLPLPVTALRSGLEYILGAHGVIELQSISVLSIVVFILVIGEEIGWRGFALPKLLPRFGPWISSAIIGVIWAFWHLPLFYIQGMPQSGSPFLPFIAYTIALSIILTFLAERTRGSVVIATLFHGAVNTFGFINTETDPEMRGWSNAFSYGVISLIISATAWRSYSNEKQREKSLK